ncbi:Predicted arabinose efflux permease, MFS family [Nocardioides terrae]|uniref:Predicted arabinose efflux permease, MFS family n=1 Tax=Nocardioides terrae TaxID=574651 RepID=A0A1I1MCN7_9ACTN|nr:MFS transporter [Nocardioides terrae]SFC82896.1 Predicted arabinose efflux permease, MFS family [Nocardioides terrae]
MSAASASHSPASAEDKGSILKQPRAVWAVAFACVISFMGLGLVDPILTSIAADLHATAGDVSLLFTSYLVVTAVAMLITGWVSSRIGVKWTLVAGLAIIVVFSAVGGLMNSVGGIVAARAVWGLGNALFIATSLATIVTLTQGSLKQAILLYESALGIGIGLGPIVGGQLGEHIGWRGPFFGVAVLMAIGLVATLIFLPQTPKPETKTSVADPIRALRHPGLLVVSVAALFYNFGFFTLMAVAPYPLQLGSTHFDAADTGWVFFGWGLALAFTSIWGANWLDRAVGTFGAIVIAMLGFAACLAAMGVFAPDNADPTGTGRPWGIVVCVIVAGFFLGINNTVLTTLVMGAAPVPRPVASAAYSFVRFFGGAVGAYVAGKVAEHTFQGAFWLGTGIVLVALLLLVVFRRFVVTTSAPTHGSVEEAEGVLVGDAD